MYKTSKNTKTLTMHKQSMLQKPVKLKDTAANNKDIIPCIKYTPFLLSSDLPQKAKHLFRKPSHLRTQCELDYLQQFTLQIKCFWQYSHDIRCQLARVLYYQPLAKGDVVIYEGTVGSNIYYIITGTVYIAQMDPSNGGSSIVIGHMGPGAYLGELALMHEGSKRKATVVCKRRSEFLTLSRKDFEVVLKKSHNEEWRLRVNLIHNHSVFNGWKETALRAITEGSSFVDYPPNTVIIKDLSSLSDYIYLVVQGSCQIVYKLKMKEFQDDIQRRRRLIMSSLGEEASIKGMTVRKWVCIYTIRSGDMFGVGEGNPGTSVLSSHRVKCLVINRHTVLKHDICGSIAILMNDLNGTFPSTDVVFGKYIEQCQWNDYKKFIIHQTMSLTKYGTMKLPPVIRTTGKFLKKSDLVAKQSKENY